MWDLVALVPDYRLTFYFVDSNKRGAPVAHWVKRWLADLAELSSSLARGEIFSTVNGGSVHTAF